MSFQLPSAASRSMVSILNDGQESQAHRNLPVISNVSCESPKEQSPASRPNALPTAKINDVMNNSYSSVSSSGTQSSNSGQSTDATSPEPSPQPPEDRLKERVAETHDEMLNVPGVAVTSLPIRESPASASTTLLHEDMDTSPDHPSFSSLERSASLPSSSLIRQQSMTNSSGSSSPSGSKKRYPCTHPGCDKTFSTSGHAARHNRIHTGTKPYRCMFPGCKATFSRQDNALAHFRTGHALTKQRIGEIEDLQDGADGAAVVRESLTDPDQQAAAQLGRKALEEGTAIAVVREGRVERTVGLPHAPKRMGVNLRETKSSQALTQEFDVREPSASGTPEQTAPRHGRTPASEYAQSRSSATFANADARQRAHVAQDVRSYHGGPASVGSNSSGTSSRVHPYHGAAPISHRTSFPNFQDQGPGGPTKMVTSTSEHSPGSVGSLPLKPPRNAVHNYDSAKPSLSQSIPALGALPASSSGLRRGSAAGFGAGGILPPPVASFYHHYPPAPSSSSGSSVSSTSSLRGHWSSLRLDSVASNMRAQRALPAWNSSSSSTQQPLQHRNSLTSSLRGASAGSRHGEAEDGTSISPPSTRPQSSSSSSQSPYTATTASTLSHPPESEQQSTRKIQLPLSSDRTGATGGSYNVSALRRSPDSSDPLRLPPLKLPV